MSNFLEKALVSRTGYTGELGYEIYYPWDKTVQVWDFLLKDKRVKPAGLGARDVLRLEMAYPLYGNDIDETITPLEAGLNKFVDLSKDFIGKDALLNQKKQGSKRKLIAFASESRRSPRHNYKIFSTDEKNIGFVTSGSFSPSLNRGIGLGYVPLEFATPFTKLMVGDQENKFNVEVVTRPFYRNGSLKS